MFCLPVLEAGNGIPLGEWAAKESTSLAQEHRRQTDVRLVKVTHTGRSTLSEDGRNWRETQTALGEWGDTDMLSLPRSSEREEK